MTAVATDDRRLPPRQKPKKKMPVNAEYEEKAKALLRSTMAQEGVSVDDLAARLAKMGVAITPGALANKISRSGFSSTFLLQCMEAMGVALIATRNMSRR